MKERIELINTKARREKGQQGEIKMGKKGAKTDNYG